MVETGVFLSQIHIKARFGFGSESNWMFVI